MARTASLRTETNRSSSVSLSCTSTRHITPGEGPGISRSLPRLGGLCCAPLESVPVGEEGQYIHLLARETAAGPPLRRPALEERMEGAIHEAFNDRWMDVVRAADRGCVSQHLRHRLDTPNEL